MLRKSFMLTSLVTATFFIGSKASAGEFRFQRLDAPGASQTIPLAINSSDQVVGVETTGSTSNAFVWSKGQFTILQNASSLSAINDEGVAAGDFGADSPYIVTYDTQTSTLTKAEITIPGFVNVAGIDASGDVVGTSTAYLGHGRYSIIGFLYNGSTEELLPNGKSQSYVDAINASGQIVLDAGRHKAVVFENGIYKRFKPPMASSVLPIFITNSGIIGGYFTEGYTYYGFTKKGNKYSTFSDPNHDNGTFVTGIGPDGQVVGYSVDAQYNRYSFVYHHGTYYPIKVPFDSDSTSIYAISSKGSIIGVNTGKSAHGFIATCSSHICTR